MILISSSKKTFELQPYAKGTKATILVRTCVRAKKVRRLAIVALLFCFVLASSNFLLLSPLMFDRRELEGIIIDKEKEGPRHDLTTTTSSSTTILTGSYHYPSSRSLEKKSNDFKVRVLLFVTTHMSAPHKWHLQSCWPPALQNSQFLDAADVAVYLNPGPAEERKEAMDILRETFKGQDLTIHVRDNQGYQEGAMAALSDATREGWFKDYEWVIRVNPDVIIRDGTFMMDVMQNDPNATGLLINCSSGYYEEEPIKIHTDFFAVKPEVLPPDAFIIPATRNAERSFTRDIQKDILDKGGARWIPGAHPIDDICRAGHERKIEDTHVIHFHPTEEMMSEMKCPIPF